MKKNRDILETRSKGPFFEGKKGGKTELRVNFKPGKQTGFFVLALKAELNFFKHFGASCLYTKFGKECHLNSECTGNTL